MKKLLILLIIIGVLVMLKPINSIIKDSIGNIIYRGNVVTGTVAVDNGDGSYDVFISESDRAYPKIFTLSANPDLAMGNKVRILYKNGCKELPIILPPVTTALTLYESQLVNDGNWMRAYGTRWLAYFFQAESNHTIEKVHLYITRTGSPGTVTISLYPNEGSGNHKPVIGGGALTTGTINGNTLVTSIGEWKEFEVTPYSLISGTWYSIVLKATSGDVSNCVNWWGTNDDVAPEKWRHSSNNEGVNWYSGAFDLTFKIYGN